MDLLKKTIEFFVYSNVFVALCVLALCQSTSLFIEANSSQILPFVFFSTLFAYNFQRLVRFTPNKKQSAHLDWVNKYRTLIIFVSIISLFLSAYYARSFSYLAFCFLIPTSVISLLYPVKLLSIGGRKFSLRELPHAKIFLIAFVWSIVSVGLVAIENQSFYTLDTLLLFISRFSFVLAITIPFDIRDLKYDDRKLKTIPQVFGESKAKRIALYSLVVFELISIIHYFVSSFPFSNLLAMLLTSALTAFLILKTSQEKHNFFFSFWVESASILMLLLLFIIPLAFGIFVP